MRLSPSRRAYTLLEVILALALAVMVVMLIGLAIDAQVTMSERGRGKVQEAQLARAVLRMIGDDLRTTVHYAPLDFSSVASLNLDADVGEQNENADGQTQNANQGGGQNNGGANNSGTGADGGQDAGSGAGQGAPGNPAGPGPGGGSTGGGGGGTGGGSGGGGMGGAGAGTGGGNQNGGAAGGGSAGSLADAASGATGQEEMLPGIYGDAQQIQIDISRLPRVDEYERMVQNGAGALADLPSDIKTVAYYVAGDGSSGGSAAAPGGPLSADQEGGLVRRSLDRAITQYAMNSGGGTGLDDSGQVIAPEVVAVSFQYWDGTQWVSAWDATEMGGSPSAVEVAVTIRTPLRAGVVGRAWNALAGGSEAYEDNVYLQVVYLPASEGASGGSESFSDTDLGAAEDAAGLPAMQ